MVANCLSSVMNRPSMRSWRSPSDSTSRPNIRCPSFSPYQTAVKLISIRCPFLSQNSTNTSEKWHCLEEIDEDIIKKLAMFSQGDLSPMVLRPCEELFSYEPYGPESWLLRMPSLEVLQLRKSSRSPASFTPFISGFTLMQLRHCQTR